ncbi:PAS domain S-box protein [Flaviaesturariibacter aridisoli]|uniref:PAS domain S-box protein n=2 Tax=Flaviaesturariibacter aridisoli TaxID=2545761 RepID=A0A4R4E1Y0_9BACT|nr:PAS domain S-box protein [Flaviaesturariibacter aridisoli]
MTPNHVSPLRIADGMSVASIAPKVTGSVPDFWSGIPDNLYRFIVENCHEGVWMINPETQTLYVNRKMAEMLGCTVDDLMGGDVLGFIDPAYRASFVTHQLLRRNGESEQYEFCLRNKLDEPVWVLIAATPIMQNDVFTGTLAMVMDISSRKQMETELLQSVQRFHLALQATRDGIWEWDFRESRMYFSARFCEILGYAADDTALERSYHAWASRIHPSHRGFVEQQLQRHLAENVPFEVEYLHLHRSGTYRWHKANGQARFDENGKPYRMAGSVRDISEEKEVEQAMLQEKAFSDSIINSLPGVFYLLDESGRLERWNRNLERVAGRSSEEVANMPALDLVAPEDRPQVLEVFEAALRQGWGKAEARLQHIDGSTRDFYFNGKLVRHGARHALVGMGIDISERKETEQLLRLSESKYRMLFDFNPVPLFMVRAKDLQFLDVNYAAMQHYQFTKEEFLRMSYAQVEFGASGNSLADRAQSFDRVVTHSRKDGQRMQMQVSHHLIDHNNEEALLFLCLDVTEKLKNEELLRRSYEEIRELAVHLQDVREKERTEIARDIHDELGQALTAVRMNLSSILRKPEETLQNLEKIREALALTEQTMSSVRKIATELRPTLLDDLGLVEALRWYVDGFRKRMDLQVFLCTSCTGTISDPQISIVIFRIVQESLTNIARHALAGKVQVSIEQSGTSLLLRIEDDGVGFDIATARKADSLGMLGLKERAQSIKGEYTVVSWPGRGTVVQVFVPDAFVNSN